MSRTRKQLVIGGIAVTGTALAWTATWWLSSAPLRMKNFENPDAPKPKRDPWGAFADYYPFDLDDDDGTGREAAELPLPA